MCVSRAYLPRYINQLLVQEEMSDAQAGRRDASLPAADPSFDAWKSRLTTRLSSALKKLDPGAE